MAKPEQTEKPTPKRRREARERGQVPRSPDIGSAAVFIAIVVTLHVEFMHTLDAAARSFAIAIANAGSRQELNLYSTAELFWRAGLPYAALIGIMFCSALGVGILANVLQFGVLFAPSLLGPHFGKLNPLPGFARIFFSTQTLVNFAKQLLKLSIVTLICWMGIKDNLTMTMYAAGHAAPRDVVMGVEGIVFGIGIRVGILLLLVGIADYAWERRRLENSLKMTKTEVKDEHRQAEGNPEAKQALRNRRSAARKRMMAAVPKATVVVTNPTHYAVALEWDEVTMEAPVLTAKGADLVARRIREVAAEHGVPILENPPLARTLYAKVELDSPVPPDLYAAVAQVIAFVYRLKNRSVAS
jgi:flagellar biosynthetic protein FlhB